MKLELLYEIAQTPTVGKLFEVKPLEIDRRNFEKHVRFEFGSREDWALSLIREAFAKVDRQPERYSFPFYTLIPEMNWEYHKLKSREELKAYANDLGGEMADWIVQALEWAQRIDNGETWENVCTRFDPIIYSRLIGWREGDDVRLVGGYDFFRDDLCSPRARYIFGLGKHVFIETVPLVVFKKE